MGRRHPSKNKVSVVFCFLFALYFYEVKRWYLSFLVSKVMILKGELFFEAMNKMKPGALLKNSIDGFQGLGWKLSKLSQVQ